MSDLRTVRITVEGPRACGKTQIADIISKALEQQESPVKVQGVKRHFTETKEILEVSFSLNF